MTHPWPSQLGQRRHPGGLKQPQRHEPVRAAVQHLKEPNSGDEDEAAMAAHQAFRVEPPKGTYERAYRRRRGSRRGGAQAAAHHSPLQSSSSFDRASEGDDENAFAPRFDVDRVLE
ncbi:hypothetical protein JCM8547_008823 [Rhodosporidiobolus lusitaniae]